MRFLMVAISLASALLSCGCRSFSARETLVGGKRVVFYPAGVAVPAVDAAANLGGWYSLTADELNAIVNP